MQADDQTFTGIELDESVAFEGDELDEGRSFSGSELDDEAPAEVDRDDAPVEADPTESPKAADPLPEDNADGREDPGDAADKARPGSRKKALFTAAAGLCTLALGAAVVWTVLKPANTVAPAPVRVSVPAALPRAANASLDFEDFVIPFHQGNSHYISLSISLRSADRAVMDELNNNQAVFRGRIYDLLKAHVQGDGGHPTLAATKEMIAREVNEWLTAGKTDGVYITLFIIQ